MKISIIVPAYNAEKYIGRCIDSLVNQTYEGVEIIIVNDGSTDGTDRVVQPYLKDKRIKYIKQDNSGALAARGAGLKKATGQYCMFVDSDDWIDTDAVEKLLKYIYEYQPDVVKFNAFVEPSHKKYFKYDVNAQPCKVLSGSDIKVMLYCTTVFHELALNIYKTGLIKNCKIFNEKMSFGEDYYVNLDVISNAANIVLVDRCFYHYYKENVDSTTKTINLDVAKANVADTIKLNAKMYRDVKKSSLLAPDYSKALFHILINYMWALYSLGKATYAKTGQVDVESEFNEITSSKIVEEVRKKITPVELKKQILENGLKYLLFHGKLIKAIYEDDYLMAATTITRYSKRAVEKNIIKRFVIQEDIYVLAFCIFGVSRIMESSSLFNIDHIVYQALTIIAVSLLLLKYIMQDHSRSELLITLFLSAVIIALIVFGAPFFLFMAFLMFVTIRGVGIKRIIKDDIAIKAIFLISHLAVFLYSLMVGSSLVQLSYGEALKGASCSLFFANPNTVGLLGTWLAIDILYLKGDRKGFKEYVVPALIAIATFAITMSRTPFVLFVVFIALRFIKNNQILFIIQKITYPVLLVLSWVLVAFAGMDDYIIGVINRVVSGRLSHSIIAYRAAGFHLFPNKVPVDFYTSQQSVAKLTVDNFFVRGFIQYGLISLAIYYLQYAMLPKSSSEDAKRVSIIMNLYLFFELTISYMGFCTPNLIIADGVINRKKGRGK